MYDRNSLFSAAHVGDAIASFWESPEGAFLAKRAKQQILAGMYELKEIDPNDWKAIAATQARIRVAECFQQWIEEGIAAGVQAQQAIQEMEAEGFGSSEQPQDQFGE